MRSENCGKRLLERCALHCNQNNSPECHARTRKINHMAVWVKRSATLYTMRCIMFLRTLKNICGCTNLARRCRISKISSTLICLKLDDILLMLELTLEVLVEESSLHVLDDASFVFCTQGFTRERIILTKQRSGLPNLAISLDSKLVCTNLNSAKYAAHG